jgi:hypothetical protein
MALQLSERAVPNGVVRELTGDRTYAHTRLILIYATEPEASAASPSSAW